MLSWKMYQVQRTCHTITHYDYFFPFCSASSCELRRWTTSRAVCRRFALLDLRFHGNHVQKSCATYLPIWEQMYGHHIKDMHRWHTAA